MTSTTPPAIEARALIRASTRAALATLMPDGAPYASLVMTACAPDASPMILISDLAAHTANLTRDGRASLLFDGTSGLANPLTGARVSVIGRFMPADDAMVRKRYVARHPDAADYAGFADFRLWRMAVARAHLVAGFGRIHWVAGDELLQPVPDALMAAESDIIEHMNRDHAEAVALYATVLLGRGGGDWSITGIDSEGIDLRGEADTARLAFDSPINGPEQARATLAALAQKARKARD
jgi:hypothetical protein